MALPLEQGRVYNLSTKAPGILGGRLTNATLGCILTYAFARKFENIDLLYKQIYPQLPPGTPESVKTCTYYVFELPSGTTKVIADQWIQEGTIELVDGINFTVSFYNKSISDTNRIRDVLNAMGEMDYVIRVET